MANPRISVCVPIHDMDNGEYFLDRLNHSLKIQTFRDFELVVTKEGKMAENTNAAIKKARGKIIKVLYMDDFLWSTNALQNIADAFVAGAKWLASGCVHTTDGGSFGNPHVPSYNPEVRMGNNTIGSPSVVSFLNDKPLLFDEQLSWLLDCDLYGRLYERYGEPTILESLDIAIGVGPHQTTHKMSDDEKLSEHHYLTSKYGETH